LSFALRAIPQREAAALERSHHEEGRDSPPAGKPSARRKLRFVLVQPWVSPVPWGKYRSINLSTANLRRH
jgi:hypothetical protein